MHIKNNSISWEVNNKQIQTNTRKKVKLSNLFVISLFLLFSGYLQFVPTVAEADLEVRNVLDDKLESMEDQSKDLREQIWELKKRAKNTADEIERLNKQNQKLVDGRQVLGQRHLSDNDYEYDNIAENLEAVKKTFTELGETIKALLEETQVAALDDDLRAVADSNDDLRKQYRKRRAEREAEREQEAQRQADENWETVKETASNVKETAKGWWRNISSEENIPTDPYGVQHTNWNDYHKARQQYEMENSR